MAGSVLRKSPVPFVMAAFSEASAPGRNSGCHMCPSCSHRLHIVASYRRRRISLVFWYSQSLLQ